jgi:RNA-directed DNA polymerase
MKRHFISFHNFVPYARQLARIIKDKSLLSLLDNIISSYQTSPGKGIPIGNLSSQYFANHLLAIADHYVKETLKIKGYVRYMDDMVLWHNDKNLLFEAGIMLKRFIADNFQQELKPFCFNRSEKGLPFLGYLVFPEKVKLAKRSRNRFAKKINIYTKKLQTGEWNQEVFAKHCQPLIAFTEHASAIGFRKKVLSNINGQWPKALTAPAL